MKPGKEPRVGHPSARTTSPPPPHPTPLANSCTVNQKIVVLRKYHKFCTLTNAVTYPAAEENSAVVIMGKTRKFSPLREKLLKITLIDRDCELVTITSIFKCEVTWQLSTCHHVPSTMSIFLLHLHLVWSITALTAKHKIAHERTVGIVDWYGWRSQKNTKLK